MTKEKSDKDNSLQRVRERMAAVQQTMQLLRGVTPSETPTPVQPRPAETGVFASVNKKMQEVAERNQKRVKLPQEGLQTKLSLFTQGKLSINAMLTEIVALTSKLESDGELTQRLATAEYAAEQIGNVLTDLSTAVWEVRQEMSKLQRSLDGNPEARLPVERDGVHRRIEDLEKLAHTHSN